MFRSLTADEVEVRVSQVNEHGVSLLLYKDARCDMRILDETVTPSGWQSKYELIGTELFCSIGIHLGSDWIWKQSNGSPSNMEAEKGRASDAFKRAGFMWGIGRELYTAPSIWIPANKCSISYNQKRNKHVCYDRFKVTKLDVEDGKITSLEIVNEKSKNVVFSYGVDRPIDALEAAKGRLVVAVSKWSAASEDHDGNELYGLIQEREDFDPTSVEFFDAVVKDIESGCYD